MERATIISLLLVWAAPAALLAQEPLPPTELAVVDHGWDNGASIDLAWKLSASDAKDAKLKYKIFTSGEKNGRFKELAMSEPTDEMYEAGKFGVSIEVEPGVEYVIRVKAVRELQVGGKPVFIASDYVESEPLRGKMQGFDGERFSTLLWTLLLCGAVVFWIVHAKNIALAVGDNVEKLRQLLKIRTIPGLEAVDEAVGRATEMGRSVLFIPGIQDMNDIQTIAGLTILDRVATTAAEFDAKVEVPTSRALVMTTARETVQAAFLAAGRPDAYNEDLIYYVTDEQFGYVAYLSGMMVREEPAACFYMGSFFAESLILAETGNSIGAIQVAGTAQPAQLPFFVAACDYTLIGEEFFAASAYLSGDPEHLGSLKGQDVGKLMVGVFVIVGCTVATIAVVSGFPVVNAMLQLIKDFLL